MSATIEKIVTQALERTLPAIMAAIADAGAGSDAADAVGKLLAAKKYDEAQDLIDTMDQCNFVCPEWRNVVLTAARAYKAGLVAEILLRAVNLPTSLLYDIASVAGTYPDAHAADKAFLGGLVIGTRIQESRTGEPHAPIEIGQIRRRMDTQAQTASDAPAPKRQRPTPTTDANIDAAAFTAFFEATYVKVPGLKNKDCIKANVIRQAFIIWSAEQGNVVLPSLKVVGSVLRSIAGEVRRQTGYAIRLTSEPEVVVSCPDEFSEGEGFLVPTGTAQSATSSESDEAEFTDGRASSSDSEDSEDEEFTVPVQSPEPEEITTPQPAPAPTPPWIQTTPQHLKTPVTAS